jgi:hypothetical protein
MKYLLAAALVVATVSVASAQSGVGPSSYFGPYTPGGDPGSGVHKPGMKWVCTQKNVDGVCTRGEARPVTQRARRR